MMTQPKLLLATHNAGKIREYAALLADLPLTVTSLRAEGIDQDVEETGTTFAENARLKAETYATWSGLWTWADDSGLEVDVLEGAPGVYSARYGGPGLSDRQRYEKLLAALRPFPPPTWTARFRCVVALALPPYETLLVEETVEGMITDRPRGEHGFGYDPVFYLPPYDATMAELPPTIKNQISHRAKAAAKAKQQLAQFMARLD